ncbi:MAG: hypothetical protein JJT96_04160 [Opitutales bacterium]|nr:hypothetical protein [Opitutales bacterium]
MAPTAASAEARGTTTRTTPPSPTGRTTTDSGSPARAGGLGAVRFSRRMRRGAACFQPPSGAVPSPVTRAKGAGGKVNCREVLSTEDFAGVMAQFVRAPEMPTSRPARCIPNGPGMSAAFRRTRGFSRDAFTLEA